MTKVFLSLAVLTVCLLAACTEPITVGSDLVQDDLADIGQTTDIPFTTRVVRDDSLLVFNADANSAIGGFTFGTLSDNVAGTWKHSLYLSAQPFTNSGGQAAAPPFVADPETDVDSIVLILPIDTSMSFYGTARNFPFNMRLVSDRISAEQSYYSDVVLSAEATPINRDPIFSASETPRFLYDTVYSNGDTVAFPHIRIAFSNDFVTDFNQRATDDFSSDSAFYAFFPGVALEPADGTDGMIALRPTANQSGQSPFAGFYFFYPDTSAAQTPRQIRRPLSLWLPSYEKDYTGALANDLLAGSDDNEQVLITGQAGLMTEITFPDLSMLNDAVINQAEVQFFLENVDGYSYTDNPSPTFIALYYRDANGDLISIEDRQRLGNPNSSTVVRQFLGGDPQTDDDDNVFYLPRFSVHMQRMVEGEVPNSIFMRVVPTDRDPSRAVFSGPEAAVHPASVRVTFTELN